MLVNKMRIVVAGIPGVGKTSVVTETVEEARRSGLKVEHLVFGSIMMEEARRLGITDRDAMRKLPIVEQRELQTNAARAIAKVETDVIFVDTHLFIKSSEGYWPGLPGSALSTLSPTNLILVEASPKEIVARRTKDISRDRDLETEKEVSDELSIARNMLCVAATLSGAPMMFVQNGDGCLTEAAMTIAQGTGLKS